MATHLQSHKITPTEKPINPDACHIRKLGANSSLVVCITGRYCPFAMPFGQLTLCKHPAFSYSDPV